jgi:glycosyltransferase involved in cell wall biosynthesis
VSDRLRIGYVYRDFNRAGSIASKFRDRAERLAQHENVIAICAAATRDPTKAPLRFETIEPLARGRGRIGYAIECASFAVRAARRIRRLRPQLDVVHVVGFDAPEADLVTVNAVRPAEIAQYFDRVEPRAHLRRRLAPLLRPQSGVVQVLERRLFRPPFPLCLAETRAVADDLQRCYGVPAEAIEVIPTGIDLKLFKDDPEARATVRTSFDVPDDRLVVLFVGDSFERKGLERAILGIARARVDAELWVAGGDRQEPYRKLARSLGCLAAIRFLGRMPHRALPALYAGCDALLLPSRQDVWGHPVIEALACGRAAIPSEYAGAHEVIEDDVNGFVLDKAGSPEQIAALLDGPLRNADVRARLGRRAVETAAAFDRDLLYERFRRAHHTAYALRLQRTREPGRPRG